MSDYTRKEFIAISGKGIATTAALLAAAPIAKAAASDRIRHAVIGTGGQGNNHAAVFSSFDDCDVVAVCDIDPARRAKALERLGEKASLAKEHEDFRDVLDNPEIDSVSIATPDHWHTPIAVLALQAGKHVYVEKPACHTVHEARMLLRAQEASGKCVQHGTQSRSSSGFQQGIEFMRSGGIGKVRVAKAINSQLREPIGRAEIASPPEGINYDLWLGPAPERPFTQNRWHYNWHWFWDYGGGDLVNDGIHQVDIARWGLGVGEPKAISASGGQLFYDDDHETPDTQVITFEYDDCYLIYEMRLYTDYPLEGHNNGDIFYGDNGTLSLGRTGAEVRFKDGATQRFDGGADIKAHMRNFLDCIKNNAPEKLNAPALEAVTSSTVCNLGNIATRVGQRLVWNVEHQRADANREANDLLAYKYRGVYGLENLA